MVIDDSIGQVSWLNLWQVGEGGRGEVGLASPRGALQLGPQHQKEASGVEREREVRCTVEDEKESNYLFLMIAIGQKRKGDKSATLQTQGR